MDVNLESHMNLYPTIRVAFTSALALVGIENKSFFS